MFRCIIKNFNYYIVLLGALLVTSVPTHVKAITPLAEQIINLSTQNNPDPLAQQTLTRAFKFKDAAETANHNVNGTNNDELLVTNRQLINYLDIANFSSTICNQTTMILSKAACEEILSHPINQNSAAETNQNKAIISFFKDLDEEQILAFKTVIAAIATIEQPIIRRDIDLLQKWVDSQETDDQKKESFIQALRKNLSLTISLKNAVARTARFAAFSLLMSGFPAAASFGTSCAWWLFNKIRGTAPVVVSPEPFTSTITSSLGSTILGSLSPVGSTFCACLMWQPINALAKTVLERLYPYQIMDDNNNIMDHAFIDPDQAIINLCANANALAEMLKSYEQPALNKLIDELSSSQKINLVEAEKNPYHAALAIIQTLYAIAKFEVYLELATFVKADVFVVVNECATGNQNDYKNYFEKMFSPPSDDEEQEKPQQFIKVTPLQQDTMHGISMSWHPMIAGHVKQTLFMHYLAQTLGIVPKEFSDYLSQHFEDGSLYQLNFQDIELEMRTFWNKEGSTELITSLTLPIAPMPVLEKELLPAPSNPE